MRGGSTRSPPFRTSRRTPWPRSPLPPPASSSASASPSGARRRRATSPATSIEVGAGASPSTWTSNGIALAGGQPVDGALATWNTQGYAAGLWTIRLVVSTPSGERDYRTPVSVDNALLEGWPRATLGGPGSYQQAVVVADLDGDGTKEVIAGSYYGLLYAWHADGTLVSGFPVEAASYGGETLTPAVGDLDGDGTMEIVVGSNGFHPSGLYPDLFVFEADGTARPGWPRISANYISDPPTLADIDGDGTLEILTGEEDWQVHAYHHDGTPVAGWPVRVDHGQNVSGISVGDLDGDGTSGGAGRPRPLRLCLARARPRRGRPCGSRRGLAGRGDASHPGVQRDDLRCARPRRPRSRRHARGAGDVGAADLLRLRLPGLRLERGRRR